MGEREDVAQTPQHGCSSEPSVNQDESDSGRREEGVNLQPDLSPQMFVVPTNTPAVEKEEGDQESGRAVTLLGEDTYPEGGLEAWLVVFGSWCGLVAALGILNSIGTLQTYVSRHQLSNYTEGTVGWIFSLYTALVFFCGIYIGPLFDKYGPRWLIGPGSVAVVAAVMITSICTGK
jgi:hypothetical protein